MNVVHPLFRIPGVALIALPPLLPTLSIPSSILMFSPCILYAQFEVVFAGSRSAVPSGRSQRGARLGRQRESRPSSLLFRGQTKDPLDRIPDSFSFRAHSSLRVGSQAEGRRLDRSTCRLDGALASPRRELQSLYLRLASGIHVFCAPFLRLLLCTFLL